MTHTQPEALRLVYKYEVVGFGQDHPFCTRAMVRTSFSRATSTTCTKRRAGIPAFRNWRGRGHEAVSAFRELWESTGGDWDANPWVWAIDFKVLSTTGRPA